MIKVVITSSDIRIMEGIAKVSGKPYKMAVQTAYFHTLGKDGKPLPFPERAELVLDAQADGSFKGHPVGNYVLHPSSVYVNRAGSLALSPRLAPVSA
jgi:Helix-destabilising protein